MRRLMSIGTALIVTLSVTACANRDRTQNEITQPQTTTEQQTTPRYATPISTQRNYKDGVYKGEGNKHDKGNEIATVTIRNGRIADVDLVSVDTTGNVKNTGMSGVNGNGGTVGNTGNNIGDGTNGPTAPGGTGTGNAGGTGTGGFGTGTTGGTGTGTGTANIGGNGTGTIDGTINGTGTMNGTGTGTAITRSIDQVRTNIITSVLQRQNYDVDTTNTTDNNLRGTADNWKLAVQRALDQAGK